MPSEPTSTNREKPLSAFPPLLLINCRNASRSLWSAGALADKVCSALESKSRQDDRAAAIHQSNYVNCANATRGSPCSHTKARSKYVLSKATAGFCTARFWCHVNLPVEAAFLCFLSIVGMLREVCGVLELLPTRFALPWSQVESCKGQIEAGRPRS